MKGLQPLSRGWLVLKITIKRVDRSLSEDNRLVNNAANLAKKRGGRWGSFEITPPSASPGGVNPSREATGVWGEYIIYI